VINWGTNAWYLSGPWLRLTTNSIAFNGAGPSSATLAFVVPRRLVELVAYNGGAASSTVTAACAGQATAQVVLVPNQQSTIVPGWTGACSPVTLGSTNGWDTNFDNLILDSGPMATPTRTNTPTSTPTPAPRAVATLMVAFDDLSNPNRVFSGQYPTGLIDWGNNAWYLSGPWGGFRTNSLSFNGPALTSGLLTFLSPYRLVQFDAYNGGTGSSTVTASCVGQSTRQISVATQQLLTVNTGWTSACSPVTFSSSNGWDTNFDSLVLDTGQAS